MTQEDKNLAVKDLCARLPYGIICSCLDNSFTSSPIDYELVSVNLQDAEVIVSNDVWDEEFKIENIKPYLRPMSSMTEEEKEYLRLNYFFEDWYSWTDLIHLHYHEVHVDEIHQLLDWFNAHHLDYRGLIGKGLALEANKDMYNVK